VAVDGDRAAKSFDAHKANDDGTTLRQAALASGYINAADFDRFVDPKAMVGKPDRDLGLVTTSSH
jgi:fumarate hydratase class II